jgi:hypothetical protein
MEADATLAELREALPTTAALSTLWLEIDRLGLTVKKNRIRRRTTPARHRLRLPCSTVVEIGHVERKFVVDSRDYWSRANLNVQKGISGDRRRGQQTTLPARWQLFKLAQILRKRRTRHARTLHMVAS